MSRALARVRRPDPPAISGGVLLLGLFALGVVLYLLFKSRQQIPIGSYQNEETYDITWDKENLIPLRIVVHRDARRQ